MAALAVTAAEPAAALHDLRRRIRSRPPPKHAKEAKGCVAKGEGRRQCTWSRKRRTVPSAHLVLASIKGTPSLRPAAHVRQPILCLRGQNALSATHAWECTGVTAHRGNSSGSPVRVTKGFGSPFFGRLDGCIHSPVLERVSPVPYRRQHTQGEKLCGRVCGVRGAGVGAAHTRSPPAACRLPSLSGGGSPRW